MNSNFLAATTLNESLGNIIVKIQELMNSFWIYIVIALAAVVVVWGAYVGIKIAIGIIIIFVVAMGAPLLINGLAAWLGTELPESAAVISGVI